MKLFCLPFAGSSASYYTKWKKSLNPSIELCPVELAGRGKRNDVPLYNDVNEAVEDIYNYIQTQLDDEPYALFGHSMGSLLVYELGMKLKKIQSEPVHVFASGGIAPHARRRGNMTHKLPLQEFKEAIKKYEGTPMSLFENSDLLELFLPVLRADIRLIEEYEYGAERQLEVFNCPMSVFIGKEDPHAPLSIADEWEKLTDNQCTLYTFEGGHFFINDYKKDIVDIINNALVGD